MFRPKFLTVKLSFFIIATTFILTPLFGDERSDQRNAERVAQQMTREDFASCVPYFSPELQTFWTASELANQWKSGTRSSG